MDEQRLWMVRAKRPLKAPTFKLFKRLGPAMDYIKRTLRERGAEATFKIVVWERLDG